MIFKSVSWNLQILSNVRLWFKTCSSSEKGKSPRCPEHSVLFIAYVQYLLYKDCSLSSLGKFETTSPFSWRQKLLSVSPSQIQTPDSLTIKSIPHLLLWIYENYKLNIPIGWWWWPHLQLDILVDSIFTYPFIEEWQLVLWCVQEKPFAASLTQHSS